MRVGKIQNTCTMIEIGDLFNNDIDSKQELILNINEGLRELSKPLLFKDDYIVMYNGSCKHIIKKLKQLGFKKVTSYKGHSPNKIQVLMWEPNKLTFCQRIRKIFY